jgi:hypothetical protein
VQRPLSGRRFLAIAERGRNRRRHRLPTRSASNRTCPQIRPVFQQMKRAEGLSVSDAQTPTLKPPPRQELHAAGMRVVQAKLSRDMCPDLSRRSTELSVQPNAQRRFVGRCHAGPPPPLHPSVQSASQPRMVSSSMCKNSAMAWQDFALAANAGLKLTAQGGKENHWRSVAYLNLPRPTRPHIKIRVLDDFEYT